MRITRRIVVMVILGFIVGAVIGGVFLHLKGNEVRSLGKLEESSFAVQCRGGSVPTVVVTWPERMESIITGLERSEEGGAWVSVGADPAVSRTRFVDTGIVAGKTYHYHVVWTGIEVVQPISVTTDTATCNATP